MEDEPIVSIILPTYNRAELLRRSINSVLKQTYPKWELIIWDDGSTDNTEEIVRSYKNPKIKYYYDNNRGTYYARNQAIKIARGKYVAFLDSDDEWMDEKLSTQVEIMNTHPRIDILFSDFLNIDVTNRKRNRIFEQYMNAMKLLEVEQINDNLFIIKDGMPESLAVENFIATDTVILRRDLVKEMGSFFEKLRNSEDFEYWWRLGLAGISFAYINKVFLLRYKYPRSLSSKSILTFENDIKTLDLCLQQTLRAGRNDLVQHLNGLYRNAWQNMIPLYGGMGDTKGTLRAFFQSMRYGFSLGSIRLLFKAAIKPKMNKESNIK
jgi:glycosyltransferase involved in cell wall biosynthesis